jgi:adenylate kinase family enzyme
MANCVIILGKSGTGKSTSIQNLDPKETVVFNVLKKKLPFKGSSSLYNLDNKNMFVLDEYTQLIQYLEAIDKKATHVKNIIIDDCIYVMRKEYFRRAKEAGYTKYTELAQHFQQIISTCENLREDINVFFILHSEDVVSDNSITGYKVSTIGKLLDSQYNPVEVVPMVLYSDIKYDDKGNATYGFYTHRTMNGTVEIPAKSPAGLFEEDFIPNDLALVVKAMNEYYN